MCFTIAPPLWPYRSGAAAIEKSMNPGTVWLLCMAVVHISGELLKQPGWQLVVQSCWKLSYKAVWQSALKKGRRQGW